MLSHTNVIITFTGSHVFITHQENENLKGLHLDDWFETNDGQKIKGSAIAEILTLSAYYNRFPDKRPVETKEFSAGSMTTNDYLQKDGARKGIIKGLQKYCDEHPEAKNAVFMLEQIKLNKKIAFAK